MIQVFQEWLHDTSLVKHVSYTNKLVTILLSFSHSWLYSPSVHSSSVITRVTLITSLAMTNDTTRIQRTRDKKDIHNTVPFVQKSMHAKSFRPSSHLGQFSCVRLFTTNLFTVLQRVRGYSNCQINIRQNKLQLRSAWKKRLISHPNFPFSYHRIHALNR